jgi:hypothetical protein
MSHLRNDGSAVTVIFWLEAPPVAHRVFASAEEANAWARSPVDSKVQS